MTTLTRDLTAARAAYGDKEASIRAHGGGFDSIEGGGVKTKAAEPHKAGGDLMKSMLFGGLDGVVTTFAVVAGAGGAALSPSVVLIMGFSSLIADALSMGVGDALSSKAESEVAVFERDREAWELTNYPEGETQEMIELYVARGVAEQDAASIVHTMAKYPKFFVDVMMRDELGMEPPEDTSPCDHYKAGLACFLAFFLCGSVPLLGYVCFLPLGFDADSLFWIASGLTACALFGLGAAKSNFTTRSWYSSGTEVLVVGGLCAVAAYGSGWAVERLLEHLGVNVEASHGGLEPMAGNATARM